MAPLAATPQRMYRKGIETIPLLSLSRPITFSTPLPDTDYEVYFRALNSLNTSIAAINKTTDGFTMTLSVSVNGQVEWFAVQNIA